MKNELIISMIIAVIGICGVFLLTPQLTTMRTPTAMVPPPTTSASSPSSTVQPSPLQSSIVLPTTPITNTTPSTKTITLADVQKHSTASDCWIVIKGKVYAVSPYLSDHPGGRDAIIPYCGNDATQAFDTIKDGQGHPSKANPYLNMYFVANITQL